MDNFIRDENYKKKNQGVKPNLSFLLKNLFSVVPLNKVYLTSVF